MDHQVRSGGINKSAFIIAALIIAAGFVGLFYYGFGVREAPEVPATGAVRSVNEPVATPNSAARDPSMPSGHVNPDPNRPNTQQPTYPERR